MDDPVTYVRDLLRGLPVPWYLCGGWAVDAWLGRRTRDHFDVDIAVLHHDQAAVFRHLEGWALVGHDPNVPDDTSEPWTGRHLDMPAHVHVPTAASPLAQPGTVRHSAVEFEFLFNERAGDDLVLGHGVTVPVALAVSETPTGVPAFTPEVVLFYKGVDHVRPRDQADFDALAPTLGPERRSWLRESLHRTDPDHPWLARIAE
jgi:hypothetical protein